MLITREFPVILLLTTHTVTHTWGFSNSTKNFAPNGTLEFVFWLEILLYFWLRCFPCSSVCVCCISEYGWVVVLQRLMCLLQWNGRWQCQRLDWLHSAQLCWDEQAVGADAAPGPHTWPREAWTRAPWTAYSRRHKPCSTQSARDGRHRQISEGNTTPLSLLPCKRLQVSVKSWANFSLFSAPNF